MGSRRFQFLLSDKVRSLVSAAFTSVDRIFSVLQTVLPLAACSVSILILFIHATFSTWPSQRRSCTSRLGEPLKPTNVQPFYAASYNNGRHYHHIDQSKTRSGAPDISWASVAKLILCELDLLYSLQLFLVICQISIRAVALSAHACLYDTTTFVCLAFWVYTAALFLPSSGKKGQLVRPHRVCLLLLNCTITVILLRSSILRPRAGQNIGLRSVELSLASLLLVTELLRTPPDLEKRPPQIKISTKPSPEERANILSKATFGWVDPILWTGYNNGYELSSLWDLPSLDRAHKVLEQYQASSRYTRLVWRLLRYFSSGLLCQGLWAVCAAIFTFAPVIVLKRLLEYLEDPRHSSKNAAWLYVVLLLTLGCLKVVAEGQALWVGKHLAIQIRAIIIHEIFSKILKARPGGNHETFKVKEQRHTESIPRDMKSSSDISQPDITASVINLMSVDSFKIADVTTYLHFLWASVPVELFLGVALLYQILGYASVAGLGIMVLLLPIKVLVARAFSRVQARIMAATDKRINESSEVFRNIRIIKYFVWEDWFLSAVDMARAIELQRLRRRFFFFTLIVVLYNATPLFITYFSFLIYTVVEGKDFKSSVAFPALSLFALLRIPLDKVADTLASIQEAKVSIDRVDAYLREDETNKYDLQYQSTGVPIIRISGVTAAWPRSHSGAFQMRNLNVEFVYGGLNLIIGPTGSGKTALLMTLLGEMEVLSGDLNMPSFTDGLAKAKASGNGVSYCAQQPWLVNDTVRENIIFGNDFDSKKYADVTDACALTQDFDTLNEGDLTLVGEKGIKLSGGQKQRIALARALYSQTLLVLLDDCLSSVDSTTSAWLFEKAILGPLMHNRTCILVTHNTEIALKRADYVVALREGRVDIQGSPDRVLNSSFARTVGTPDPDENLKRLEIRDADTTDTATVKSNLLGTNKRSDTLNKATSFGPSSSNTLQKEAKAKGSIRRDLLSFYFRAMGRWYYWLLMFFFFFANQISTLAIDLWIRQWSNAYQERDRGSNSVPHVLFAFQSANTLSSTHHSFGRPSISDQSHNNDSNLLRPKVNDQYYLLVYVLIAVGFMLIKAIRMGILFKGSLSASRLLHGQILRAVTRARFAFYDSTPLGQIVNRFSRDLEIIDQELALVLLGYQHAAFSALTIWILISVITPAFLLPGILISLVYFTIGKLYINTSRDLKRLESIQRSPLYQHFEETLAGVITIRAYGHEQRFFDESVHRLDNHSRPFLYLGATNTWLAFRVDVTSALISFFAGAFVVIYSNKIDPGAAGLSLSYAITFTEHVLWLVKFYGQNEQNMVS